MNRNLEDIKNYLESASLYKQQIINDILNLPDNTNIKRTEPKSNSFVMSFHNFSQNKNMNVEHYDFKTQYKAVADYLEHVPLEKMLSSIENIINTGKVNRYPITLHPEVVKNLHDYFGF
jgi:hypothetical protein